MSPNPIICDDHEVEQLEVELDRSSLTEHPFLARHLVEVPELPAIRLSERVQPIARRAWEERARSEYVGVMVVRRFHGLLVDVNAPMDLQELALAMLVQEQQHATLCMAAARSLGSDGVLRFDAEELRQARTDAPVDHQLLEMIVASYCVGEVVALALIQHSIEVLPPSPYRDILRRIAKDEVLHGRLGEPLLALARSDEGGEWLDYPGDDAVRKIATREIEAMKIRDVVEADEAALFEDPEASRELTSVGIPPAHGFSARYFEALAEEVESTLNRALGDQT